MITADQVFEYIRETGPVLPKDISAHFGIDTLFASAYLSELSSKGMVQVSNIKVGGSPLYYTSDQKEKLSVYRENLHEKEQKTYEFLKSAKVLEDLSLDLVDRVALRKMKDYAIPLNVVMGYEKRLFWKFFTVSDGEAQQIISAIINPPQQRTQEPVRREEPIQEAASATTAMPPQSTRRSIYPPINETQPQRMNAPSETKVSQRAPLQNVQEEEQIAEQNPQEVAKEETKPAEKEEKKQMQKPAKETTAKREEKQSTITAEQKPPEQLKIQVGDSDYSEELQKDNFGKALIKYFSEKQIILIFSEITKKDNEIFGTISLPSAIGDLEYFFYAKNKKSINEKDIKDAYAESVLLGYPLLFIAKGKLSKNAVTFVDSKLKSCKVVEI